MNWLQSIIEDNSGGLSSIRILMLIWGIGVFGVWLYVSIHTGSMSSVPDSIITILLGTTAVKTVQRFGEK